MKIDKYINIIENNINNSKKGLPEEIFLFASRITPLINVDLLIKNKQNQTLLTWRQKGQVYPEGWHIPGGIIRYKEKYSTRVKLVAKTELNCEIKFNDQPIAINQIMLKQKNRGHFISLLFSCKLFGQLNKKLKYNSGRPKVGEWSWHSSCPKNLIFPHKIYKRFF